jgi:hypothetical protein
MESLYILGFLPAMFLAMGWYIRKSNLIDNPINWIETAATLVVGVIIGTFWPLAAALFGGHWLLTMPARRKLKARKLRRARHTERMAVLDRELAERRPVWAKAKTQLHAKQRSNLNEHDKWQREYDAIDSVHAARRRLTEFRQTPWDNSGLSQLQHGYALHQLGAKLIRDELHGDELQALTAYLISSRRDGWWSYRSIDGEILRQYHDKDLPSE